MHKISLQWQADELFRVSQNGKTLLIDGADEATAEGFRPKPLILSALAGCTAIDVVEILRKMRAEFSAFSIDVEADMTEEHPKVYHSVRLVYRIRVPEGDRHKVERAVQLSQEKYCGVSAMVRRFANLEYRIEYL
ncbi:MAG: OsmC family protein [Chitinophagales bacterium]|nr:OsmC family protein [Chitinophagales bacterium]MDW8419762.1 OsmC family protein [Chitinophagales bacterium]